MKYTKTLLSISTVFLLSACGTTKQAKEELFTQHLAFPNEATLEEKVNLASRLVPSPAQLDWQDLELTAFVHFGINTFTGREWGDGSEDPALYNPTNLDTDQWVRELKDAGFRMVILTAKHHDGFCLWQTKTTKHSVEYSPAWKNGEGDVMKKLSESCKKYGMKLGVYLSPWDRNNPTYGTGDAYNKLYLEQLTELLSNYGQVDEVWFDGANAEGPNGKKQIYDWDSILSLIHDLQPNAVTAIMGTEVRWVGNERGLGRETEWSATPLAPNSLLRSDSIYKALNISPTSKDLGSRELLEKAGELFWYPSEVDTSIRQGWFYHPDEAPKSIAELANIYFSSVGMNSTLLLNIPPTKEGRFSDEDVSRLREFGAFVKAFNSSKTSTQEGFLKVGQEGDLPSVSIDLDDKKAFDAVMLREDISRGQRVEAFDIEALIDGAWGKIASGTTIGHKRIILLADGPISATKLRVTLTSTRNEVGELSLGTYKIPVVTTEYSASNTNEGLSIGDGWNATISSDGIITTTLDGSYKGFIFKPQTEGNTVMHFRVLDASGKEILSDAFDNIVNSPTPRKILFPSPVGDSIKLILLDESDRPVQVDLKQITLVK